MKAIGTSNKKSGSQYESFAAAHGADFSMEMVSGFLTISALRAAKKEAAGFNIEEYRVIENGILYSISVEEAERIMNAI